MGWNTFARSLRFAALAAAGTTVWLALTRPLLGAQAAVACYLVAATVGYVGAIVPQRRRRAVVLLGTAAVGGGMAFLAGSLGTLAVSLAVLLAGVRSGVLYRAPMARAIITEAILIGAGLLFARFLAGGSALAVMLALWGFLLVQSVYFLVGGVRPRAASGGRPDPFDEAHDRALALLRMEV